MDAAQIGEAARLLLDARRTGRKLRELPSSCRPATAGDVTAIIDAISRELDEPVAGWKLALLYAPRQKAMICPLYRSNVLASPARVKLSHVPSRRIEPEISFKLTRDLPARAAKYQPDEVASAVIACPSLEMVDSRFDTEYRSLRQRLDEKASRLEAFADHITTGAYVVAEGRKDWQAFDFAAMRVVMRTPKQVLVETVGGHAFIDPFLPCVVLANEMRHRGGMTAGQIMVTGSFSGFFEVPADEPVTAEFEGFGSVEGTFVTG